MYGKKEAGPQDSQCLEFCDLGGGEALKCTSAPLNFAKLICDMFVLFAATQSPLHDESPTTPKRWRVSGKDHQMSATVRQT